MCHGISSSRCGSLFLGSILGEEGGDDQNWAIPETVAAESDSSSIQDFAPRGTSKFQERVRNKLPEPLELGSPVWKRTLSKVYDTCSV